MKQNIFLVILLIIAGALGLYVGNVYKKPSADINISHSTERPAPVLIDFSRPLLSGDEKSLSDWKGKVIILNFWATWCPPCRKEIPTFVALQKKWQDKNVQFIGVAMDDHSKVAKFAKEHQMNYPNMIGSLDDVDLTIAMGNTASVLPFSVVIDQNFTIIASHAGEMTESMLESVVLPLIK